MWEVEVVHHTFLRPALLARELKASVPGRKPPSTCWIGSWLYPRCNLDVMATRETIVLAGNQILIATHSLVCLMTELSKLLSYLDIYVCEILVWLVLCSKMLSLSCGKNFFIIYNILSYVFKYCSFYV